MAELGKNGRNRQELAINLLTKFGTKDNWGMKLLKLEENENN